MSKGTLAEVEAILHDKHGWSEFAGPAPIATAVALETAPPSDVASALTNWVKSAQASYIYPSFWQATYSLFCRGREYWEHDTAIALGQQVEFKAENVGRATTVTEWMDRLNHGYNRQGYKDLNAAPWTKQGQLRRAAAETAPPEFAGYEQIWALAVIAGYIPVGLTGFDPAYMQKVPRLSEIRGLDAQKWVENLTYLDLHPGDLAGIPWPPQRPVKK